MLHEDIRSEGMPYGMADFDGKPVTTPYNPNSHLFAYDSWRTAMNWSIDWAWWKKAPHEQELSNRIQAFFAAEGLATYGHIYTLAGQRIGASHAAGLAATHPVAREFVEALWALPVPSAPGDRYYEGLLYPMSMLHCSGQFRIYEPR